MDPIQSAPPSVEVRQTDTQELSQEIPLEVRCQRLDDALRLHVDYLFRTTVSDSWGRVFYNTLDRELRQIQEQPISLERYQRAEAIQGLFYAVYHKIEKLEWMALAFRGFIHCIEDGDVEWLEDAHELCAAVERNQQVLPDKLFKGLQELLDQSISKYVVFIQKHNNFQRLELERTFFLLSPENQALYVQVRVLIELMYKYAYNQDRANRLTRMLQTSNSCWKQGAFLRSNCTNITVPADETTKKIEKPFSVLGDGVYLDAGAYRLAGKVRLHAEYPTERPDKVRVVSKLFFPCLAHLDVISRECAMSKLLRASGVPFILKAKRMFYTTDCGERNLGQLSEYCSKGNFYTLIQRRGIALEDKVRLSCQLVQSIQKMHALGYCHLDLKSQNIFVTEKKSRLEVRIGDLSSVCKEGVRVAHCSTYPAPEMVSQKGMFVTARRSMDLWSLGDLLFEMRFGFSVFQHFKLTSTVDPDLFELRVRGVQDTLRETILRGPEPVDQCILRLFSYRPEERPSIDEVMALFGMAEPSC